MVDASVVVVLGAASLTKVPEQLAVFVGYERKRVNGSAKRHHELKQEKGVKLKELQGSLNRGIVLLVVTRQLRKTSEHRRACPTAPPTPSLHIITLRRSWR
jgi:hypothetical protein